MGTTTEIIRVNEDGKTIDLIHISYDGYLSGVGLNLFQHYNDAAAVEALFGYRTAAVSLEADPIDMSWSEWDDAYRNKDIAAFMEEQIQSCTYHMTPTDIEAQYRLVAAMAKTGIVTAAPKSPPVTSRFHSQTLKVGEINPGVDVRNLPDTLREQLPDIVEATFGRRLKDSFFAYGQIGRIADYAAVPLDFRADSYEDGSEDEDEISGVGYFVWAHGRWAYPRTFSDMQTFIETGQSPQVLTRDLFIADGVSEETLDTPPVPRRPVNEIIGVLTLNEAEETATITSPGQGLVYLGFTQNCTGIDDIFDMDGKTVRVLYTAFMVTAGSGGSQSSANVNLIELIQ